VSKRATLLFIAILTVSSLTVIESALAQSVPKPSVPDFTVKLVAHPYDVPPTTTTTIDQYTGKEIVTTTPGYHVENKSIEITIKNQPFTPYTDTHGYEINLYYNVRSKGHFGDDWDWKELYSHYKGSSSANPVQSSSEYTVLSLSADYPDDAQVDFQVEAIVGHYYDELAGRPILPLYVLSVDQPSGWSSTQTITIGEDQTSTPSPATTPTSPPSSTPYQEPQQTEQIMMTGLVITMAIIVAGLGLLIYLIKRR
jgi:hypothetical protein